MVVAAWIAGDIVEALSSSRGAERIPITAPDMDQNPLLNSFQHLTGILNENYAVTYMHINTTLTLAQVLCSEVSVVILLALLHKLHHFPYPPFKAACFQQCSWIFSLEKQGLHTSCTCVQSWPQVKSPEHCQTFPLLFKLQLLHSSPTRAFHRRLLPSHSPELSTAVL